MKGKSLSRPIINDKIDSVIKSPTTKDPGPDGFIGEFHQTMKAELTPGHLRGSVVWASDS